jgi:16S rRNA (guanine527-N7)-methyltransferase
MEKLTQDALNLLGIRLTPRQIACFQKYEQELLAYNAQFNLTAIRDSEGIRAKHFLDSLTCIRAWRDNPPSSLIDVGTGAGFPGIPLKIFYPQLSLALVESVGKKAEFCRHVTAALNLERVEVIQARAEEVGQMPKYRERFDWAVARAVAGLPILVEFLLPLVRIGGGVIAMKGESGPAEAHASEKAIRMLGGRMRQLMKVDLPGVAEDRYLVIIDKIAAVPPNYPRRVGIPMKKPLT